MLKQLPISIWVSKEQCFPHTLRQMAHIMQEKRSLIKKTNRFLVVRVWWSCLYHLSHMSMETLWSKNNLINSHSEMSDWFIKKQTATGLTNGSSEYWGLIIIHRQQRARKLKVSSLQFSSNESLTIDTQFLLSWVSLLLLWWLSWQSYLLGQRFCFTVPFYSLLLWKAEGLGNSSNWFNHIHCQEQRGIWKIRNWAGSFLPAD